MTTRSRRPGAGFDWLKRGITVGFRHPKPLFGGAVLLLVASLIPSLVSLSIRFHLLQPTPATFLWSMAASILLTLLIMPLDDVLPVAG